MNNYCTNCGKKLEKKELKCSSCGTPIVKIPNNYTYLSPEKAARRSKVITIIVYIFALIVAVFLIKTVVNKIYENKLQKNYVEPYLQERYPYEKFDIEFDSSGKCIVSGDCLYDPVMGCDGGACNPYNYLDEKECHAYYYKVSNNNDYFTVTVVKNKDQYYAVRGVNIYGADDTESNNALIPYESDYNHLDEDVTVIFPKYDAELHYYAMKFHNMDEITFSGTIKNIKDLKGRLKYEVVFYDYNQQYVKKCDNIEESIDEVFDKIQFSCTIKREDFKSSDSDSIDNIYYYKVSLYLEPYE